MTNAGYHFGRNIKGLQEHVAALATVYGLDVFMPAADG